MADLLMVLLMTAFIGVCVLYVRWCDHIIGPDPARTADTATTADTRAVADEPFEVVA